MQKISLCILLALSCKTAFSQPLQRPAEPVYIINHMALPAELDKQVCISGMKYFGNDLYLVSERCPSIFVLDPQTATIKNTIHLQVSQEFEMEGMTSYKDKLYLVSENLVAVYEVDPLTSESKKIAIDVDLPNKTKSGDGMEGIAANEVHNKFYLLRERTENQDRSQLYTFSIEKKDDQSISLKYEATIELVLENPQWRYSDICVDSKNSRLLLLKSYSKGKLRQQFLESLDIDNKGTLASSSLKNVPVDNFSTISAQYKDQDYSMNLEGITIDDEGKIFMVSDNTSGKAQCDLPAKEKTILLRLSKN